MTVGRLHAAATALPATGLADLFADAAPGMRAAVVLAVAVLAGLLAHALVFRGAGRLGRRAPALLVFDGALLRRSHGPAGVLFPLLAVRWALPWLDGVVPARARAAAHDVLHVLLVATVAWGLVALTGVLEDVAARRLALAGADDLRARAVRTQVGVLRRVLAIVIGLVALGAVAERFQGLETFGTGLVASAGVIGVVVSIAAQRPLGNLVAGVQLALTQPIRVGDAVVVENEWGTVEEITLAYVVVRIWDARRLVVPIAQFFEKPFQNWTRTSAQIIGTVFWSVDYGAPVAAIRAECERLIRASARWDGHVCQLQVTDATERAVQLRAVMSAPNAGAAWDLRCEVREGLIEFLQRAHPGALPRLRLAEVREPEALGRGQLLASAGGADR